MRFYTPNKMKNILFLLLFTSLLSACSHVNNSATKTEHKEFNELIGSWKLVYNEIRVNDTVEVKDLSNSNFIKIINNSHFAFFNQVEGKAEGFYGGGGSYTLEGDKYIEHLDYISQVNFRNHVFPFTIEIKGDSLIQYGLEEVKEANIKRFIVEKYLRVK